VSAETTDGDTTMTTNLTDAERREAIAAIDAEIAQLQAERAALAPTRCTLCWEEFDADIIDVNGECYSCARRPDTTDDERRAEYYASIAGGCV
jgi:predicted Zn-ribbon and HTH transcriptional regulator